MDDVRIEPLGRPHVRDQFDCGQPSLDDFLRVLVTQYEKRHLGRTYVAVRGSDPRVLGDYTIAAGLLAFDALPSKAAKKRPRHPVPTVLIARLAVDRAAQGQHLGEKLLLDAFARCLELAERLGIHAVVVEAIDDQAKAFYEKYQFIALLDRPLHLYLPISTVRDVLAG
jgi:ribosomal protein S18 acetylase RimI-like enzyme